MSLRAQGGLRGPGLALRTNLFGSREGDGRKSSQTPASKISGYKRLQTHINTCAVSTLLLWSLRHLTPLLNKSTSSPFTRCSVSLSSPRSLVLHPSRVLPLMEACSRTRLAIPGTQAGSHTTHPQTRCRPSRGLGRPCTHSFLL